MLSTIKRQSANCAVLLIAIALPVISQAAFRPNIVIILADDLGWNDVGYHGSEINTPHLDELASAGVVLNQFHSQPTCTPTRAALLTGKSPQSLGIYRQFTKNSKTGLPENERTLAEYFRNVGYQTFLTGKWHLGHARRAFHPNARGFDHYYGNVTGGIGYWDHVHGGGLDWQRNGVAVREEGYSTHLIANEAINLIRTRKTDSPFLLFASFNAPHLPNEAPETTIADYAHILDPHRRVHAAMVTEFDMAIGQLIEVLEEEEVLDNTLIWFMSDNGGLNQEAALNGYFELAKTLESWFGAPLPIKALELIRVNSLDGGSDNHPLRKGKGSVYQGGVRVPSLVCWRGLLEHHKSNAMITVQDVLPTILGAAGIPSDDKFDGKDRWPAISRQILDSPPDYITIGQQGAEAYYRWPWKLIARDETYELFNLEVDPTEQHDLVAEHPRLVAELAGLLSKAPRAKSLHTPMYQMFLDPDFFGGEEDRPPWTELLEDVSVNGIANP